MVLKRVLICPNASQVAPKTQRGSLKVSKCPLILEGLKGPEKVLRVLRLSSKGPNGPKKGPKRDLNCPQCSQMHPKTQRVVLKSSNVH